MRNPALLAAELSGRPMFMLETAVPGYARMLGVAAEADAPRNGFAALLGRARRVLAAKPAEPEAVTGPRLDVPDWMGEAEPQTFGWTLVGSIGVLQINGPLMAGEGFCWDDWYWGYDSLLKAYEEMSADARVKAIWTRYDTNGGVCDDGLGELAEYKRTIRAAAGGKPCWAFVSRGYSAGYYIIAQDDHVIASRGSGVGSIGAVCTWCGIAGSLAQEGIEVKSFKFGAKKTDGSALEPLSDSASVDLQAEINQQGRWFVADVAAGRPSLSEEVILATQAGCYFGDSDDDSLSGLKVGLVDAVMSERAAWAALQALVSDTSDLPDPILAPTSATRASKEPEMKRTDVLAAAARANLSAEDLSRLETELPEAGDDEGGTDDADTDDTDDEGDPNAADEGDDNEAQASAKAISGTPEAKANPHAALAAINAGLTVDQFKTMAAAPGGKDSPLRQVMTGRRRLGPDGAQPSGGGSGLVANARALKEKSKR